MSEYRWHGLSDAGWIVLWDASDWREEIGRSMREVVACADADTEVRLLALATLNDAICSGIVPADSGFPEYMRDALLLMISGKERRSWFGRARKSAECAGRVRAARNMLGTSTQFIKAHAADQVTEVEKKPDLSWS